ncbi:MAG: ribokinase [Candidatus Cryptobacteroides sp.]
MKEKKILVIGSSNTDMTIKADKLPLPGETILGGKFILGPGGKGANQAVAARRLGGNVEFVCKVGKDIFGKNSIEGYIREGIDMSHTLYSDEASGIALILVDGNGENMISVAPGANGDLTVEDIESIADTIREADYLILQLEIPVESVLRAAQIAHEAGVYVILNPAPACNLPSELFHYISLIIPNQTETYLMTGIELKDEASFQQAVKALNGMGVKDVIITLGSKGSLVFTGRECRLVPAKKVKAVDATAAGDTFCGALCVSLSKGSDLAEAAEFATKASAITVQTVGAQNSIPYIKDIN